VRNGIEIASFSLWQLAEPKSSLQGKKP
jgi:hypothetical protein